MLAVTHDEEKDLYQVTVEISSAPENDQNPQPYTVNLIAVGIFQVNPDWKEPEKLLSINGASILYSAAREYLITINLTDAMAGRYPANQLIPQTVSRRSRTRRPISGKFPLL